MFKMTSFENVYVQNFSFVQDWCIQVVSGEDFRLVVQCIQNSRMNRKFIDYRKISKKNSFYSNVLDPMDHETDGFRSQK